MSGSGKRTAASVPLLAGRSDRRSNSFSGPMLPPLLELSRTPPPPSPFHALSRTMAVAASAAARVAAHVIRCSCLCLAVVALLIACVVVGVILANRPPSVCARRNFHLPWLREAPESDARAGLAFNDTSARHHSRLAAAAYCEPAVVQRWACEACERTLVNVTYFQSSILDAAGYVGVASAEGRPHLVVAFRGSTTDRNWVLDAVSAKHLRRAWGGGAVHLGFHEAYDTLQTYVHELLSMKRQQLIDARLIAPLDRVSVHLVGHSLGGALATLAAADLHTNRFFDVGALWTFGSPRVGDDQFASWLAASVLSGADVTHWRVTHAYDPVVHVPPVSMGFAHVPTEVWYPDEDPDPGCAKPFILCDDRRGEDPRCSARIWLPLCVARSADHLAYVGVPYDHAVSCADRQATALPLLAAA